MNITEPAERVEHVNGSALQKPPRPTRAERKTAAAAEELRRLDLQAEIARKRDEAAEAQQDRRDQREQRRKTRKSIERSQTWKKWAARLKVWRHTFVLVGAIVGVNIVAVAGQVTAFQAAPFDWTLMGALGAAAVVESIAIFVGWHAHVALREGDSVFRLRASSYGIATAVAVLNYHHYSPDWRLDDQAAMFGAASLLSPWLWAIHSRHLHRQDLRKAGLIDPRAPKFSALRWLLHRPETWQALKWAVRHGEQSPTAAILAVQGENGMSDATLFVDRAHIALAAGRNALIEAQAAALAATEMYVTVLERAPADVSPQPAIEAPPADPGPDTPTDDLPDTSDVSEVADEPERERPDAEDNREAERWIRERMRAGRTPKQADIATKYGFSNGWASLRVKAARADLSAKGYRFLPGNVVQPPTDPDTSATDVDVSDTADEMAAAPTGDQS
ncbi:hypothetical protein [Nonomuraea sp. NPDC050643]|uniref:hypothetical protein n=1 Tax=Nonomuraea sp. NPDC050643 TaxID=3155660 RepID=UPI003411D65B